jgi:hypothetical protein
MIPPKGICLPATVISAHDGDTATVDITVRTQVRYLNCWSKELNEPGGKEAAASAKLSEGKHGRIFIPLNDARTVADLFTFGRVLGEIWIDGSEESESQRQVRLGLASTAKGKQLGT